MTDHYQHLLPTPRWCYGCISQSQAASSPSHFTEEKTEACTAEGT